MNQDNNSTQQPPDATEGEDETKDKTETSLEGVKKTDNNNLTMSTKLSTDQLICKSPKESPNLSLRCGEKEQVKNEKKIVFSCFNSTLYLGVLQILFGMLMSVFGVLVIVHGANLSQIGGGLWGGCLAVATGTTGVLAAAKECCPLKRTAQRVAHTVFLALSLISLAVAQLVLVVTATGLARDVSRTETEGELEVTNRDVIVSQDNNGDISTALLSNIGLLIASALECICAAIASYQGARAICPCFRSGDENHLWYDMNVNATRHALVSSWLGKQSPPPLYVVTASPSSIGKHSKALPLVTVIVGSKISGDDSTIVTLNNDIEMPRKVTFPMPCRTASVCKVSKTGIPKWALYVKGVVANYIGKAPTFQAVIISSVPTGGGLSSSAALEVSTYTFLDALSGPNSTLLIEKALACQKAEHEYAGMPCGIMDQFISFMGKKDRALLIDCKSVTSSLIPFFDSNIVILVTNSNVKHELTGSEYPTRRKQCEQAAALLNKPSLREAVPSDVEVLKSLGADPDVIKRARHVISEIERTSKAADALSDRNFNLFGELMVESHVSLKEDYEVSCSELDSLVELALQVQGVLGSRMTGGGFGGCTVTMVHRDSVGKVIDNITNNYSGRPTFYVCKPSEGARVL